MEKNQNLEEMQETTILNPNENDEGNAKKPAKKTIIVSTIAAVVVLAGVGGGYAYASNTTYDSYESQLESAKEADSKLVKTLAEARTLVKATKETDVLDKTMLDSLTKSIKTGDALKGVPTTSHATKWNLWGTTKANTIVADDNTEANDSIDAINKAMRKVNKSKTDKQVKDARSTLDKTISDAETLYKDSEGKVQDNKTRESLKTAIDTAKKTVDDKKSDVKTLNAQKDAVSKAVKSVNDSKTAKEQADAEAKAEEAARQAAQQQSQAQAQTYSNTNYNRTNSGTSTYSAPTQHAQTQQSAPQQSQNQNNSSSNSGYIKLCATLDSQGNSTYYTPCN
jgi:colicin import membrane protein